VDFVKSNFYNYYGGDNRSERVEFFKAGECGRVMYPDDFAAGCMYARQPSVWSAIYNAEFLRDNSIDFLPTPGASYQDTSFAFKVFAKARSAYFIYDAYLHYRQDNEQSSVNNSEKIFCVCDEFGEINKFLDENPELKRVIEPHKAVAMYRSFMWNYERLIPEYRYGFLIEAHKWFKEIAETGVLDEKLFGSGELAAFREIAVNPMKYHIWRTIERYEQCLSENPDYEERVVLSHGDMEINIGKKGTLWK